MPRLPEPGKDAGQWGEILNEYLGVSLAGDGTIKTDTVGAPQLRPGAVTNASLATGTIAEDKLSSAVQTKLSGKIDSASIGVANGVASLDGTSKLIESQLPTRLGETELNTTIAEAISASASGASSLFPDRGQQFMAKLKYGSENLALGIAGDSTGNSTTEWADLLVTSIGAQYPSTRVVIKQWSDVSLTYNADIEVQPGISGEVGVVFLDTFSRVAAEVYNTEPDLGAAWGRDGSNGSGDWSADGSKAIRSTDTTGGTLLADVLQAGKQKLTLHGNFSTTSTGVTRLARMYSNYVDPNNNIYSQLSISASGVPTVGVYARTTAGGVRTVATASVPSLATNAALQAITWTLGLTGSTVSVTVNSQTISGAITSPELAVYASGTKGGFSAGGWQSGDSINDFQIEITDASAPRELVFWNASAPGTTLTYQQPLIASMFPVPLDLLFVSSVHNYGGDLASAYWPKIDTFISAFKVYQPTAGIIISSQNPRKPPASSPQHAARCISLSSYTTRRGYGYLPVYEAFADLNDGGWSLVKSDGIHPTEGDTNTGSSLWRDVALAYLASI